MINFLVLSAIIAAFSYWYFFRFLRHRRERKQSRKRMADKLRSYLEGIKR